MSSFASAMLTKSAPAQRFSPELAAVLPELPSARLALEASLARALEVIARQQSQIVALQSEAQTDAMTGALNRRGFAKALGREIERARRQQATTALLVLFDLDGLKQVNDTHGHGAGDAYIMALADGLSTVRATDYVARLGGDEFALLLTDAAPEAARRRVEKLVAVLNGNSVRYAETQFPLAVSHGCIEVKPGAEAKTLFALADKELYQMKAQRLAAFKRKLR